MSSCVTGVQLITNIVSVQLYDKDQHHLHLSSLAYIGRPEERRRNMLGSEEKDSNKSRRTFLKEVGFLNLIAATLGRSVAISSGTSRSQSSLSQSANKT